MRKILLYVSLFIFCTGYGQKVAYNGKYVKYSSYIVGYQIPAPEDVAQWIDGTISGDEFVDQSGHGYNLDIIGKDFPTSWTKGFPSKSNALIAQKASTFGKIPNPNYFWFQADGTPNQIPGTSLYQSVDYSYQIFCKWIPEAYNSNGAEIKQAQVLDIVTYNSVQTGGNLILCNSFFGVPTENASAKWVAKDGSDATGDGSKSTPYKTINKALTMSSVGGEIYIKTGDYNETTSVSSSKNITYTGLGYVVVRSTGAGTVFYQSQISATYNGLIVSGSDTKTYLFQMLAGASNDMYTVTVDRCKLDSINAQITIGYKGYGWILTNSIINKATTFNFTCQRLTMTGCYVHNAAIRTYTTIIANRNYCLNDLNSTNYMFTADTSNFTYIGNTFDTKSVAVYSSIATGITTRTNCYVNYNDFIIRDANSATSIICSPIYIVDSKNSYNLYIQGNTINQLGAMPNNTATYIYCIRSLNNLSTITDNIITSEAARAFYTIDVEFTSDNNNHAFTISRNNILTAASGGASITIGNEQVYNNNCNGSTIEANKIVRSGAHTDGVHGIFVNCGINNIIKYNYVENVYVALAIKAGAIMQAYTSGGVYGNVTYNCIIGCAAKGIGGMNVFNNTIFDCQTIGLYFLENDVQAGYQYCENIICKNNIVTCASAVSGSLVTFDQHAADNGCIAEYNVLYSGQYLLTAGSTTYTDLSTAQAAGKLLNCVVTNPNFVSSTQLWPTVVFTQTQNLGTEYNTGLDITTAWSSNVVTKTQGATWQNGGYVQ